MSMSGSKGLLTLATRNLQARWGETRFSWRDRKAREFEEAYLEELMTSVNSALRVIDELDKLLEKVHADCD
jgi:vacuolar-type H+-ATPase subunit B/Vma2